MLMPLNLRRVCRTSPLLAMLLLQACAIAPPVVSTCPALPPAPAMVELGPDFQGRMLDFLSGNLPAQTDSAKPLPPVTPGSKT